MRARTARSLLIVAALLSIGADPQSPPAPIPCAGAPSGMSCIPGGPFIRGSDDGPPHSRPAAEVWVQTFYMDIHEVTVAEYKACIKAGKCRRAGPNYKGYDRPRQPITGVSWYDAVQFCEAHGKHLPTEAEWEKAARGTEGWLHPWGDEPATCERAVIQDKRGRSCGVPKEGKHPEKGQVLEVGSRPVGIYDLYDMSGNSWEWVYDWYSKSYAKCGEECAGIDPRGPCDGREKCRGNRRRVVRGGSWYWDASYATSIWRRSHVPGNDPFHHFGFRCAASVTEGQEMRPSS